MILMTIPTDEQRLLMVLTINLTNVTSKQHLHLHQATRLMNKLNTPPLPYQAEYHVISTRSLPGENITTQKPIKIQLPTGSYLNNLSMDVMRAIWANHVERRGKLTQLRL